MPRITAKELKARRREFVEEAERAFDRMLSSDGQNGLVTFEQREERGCELRDGLTRRLLEEHQAADDRAEAFHERRPHGPAVGRNHVKLRQPAG